MKTYIFCTNPIFAKIFVLVIWWKIFSVNQITGFFNQAEQINEIACFLHVDTSLHKLKVDQIFFGWAWSKMGMVSLVTVP